MPVALMKHILLSLSLTIASTAAFRSSQAQTASQVVVSPAATMTFDVSSVRENKNIDFNAGVTVGGGFVDDTATFRAVNWSIDSLIANAYGVDRSRIENLPKWPFPTMFMIEAKSDRDADRKLSALTKEQQTAERQHMLQVLLEERFHFQAHWETKQRDVYRLVQAKSGARLKPADSIPPSSEEIAMFKDHPIPTIHQRNDGQGNDYIAHGCSLPRLAEILTLQFGRPVYDATGLHGEYDFVLTYKGRWDRDRNPEDLDPMPPLDRALQEQLGLRVEDANGAVSVIVVDRAEKPADN